MFGLTGAQRTGKSTLARVFSENTGVPALYTSAREVFAELSLNPKVDYPLEVRLGIQRRILDSFDKQYRSVEGGVFIADRTPIDMMAYTLADIQRGNVPQKLEKEFEQYMADCIALSNSTFSILAIVQPGIPLADEEGKAPATFAYMEHINILIMGLVVSEAVESAHYYIPRAMLGVEQRVEAMKFAVKRTQERFDESKSRRLEMGCPLVFH